MQQDKKDWWPHEFRNLVTLGESTTAGGWSTCRERSWPWRLKDMIDDFQMQPIELFNAGIGANVISSRSPCYEYSGKPAADERLEKHVLEQHPDLLIMSYGLNDSRGGTPTDLFAERMIDIVRSVRARIAPLIVLLGPYYAHNFKVGREAWHKGSHAASEQFNRLIARIAEEHCCLFVDLLAANGRTDWMVHFDGVHANDLGHRIVANRVFEVLAQNCSGLAKKTKLAEQTSPRWRDESTLKSDCGYKHQIGG